MHLKVTISIYIYINIGKIWESVSESAKDLIKLMLAFNPELRISAQSAYKHPWLNRQEFKALDPKVANEIVCNMGKFCVIYINLFITFISLLLNYSKQL